MRAHLLAPLILLAAFAMAIPARAASTVSLTPGSGHPTLPFTIAGSGFGANEAIDVYVDTVDTLLLVSSASGTFSGSLATPATAQPGKHYITAIGRRSGDAAQKPFVVTTFWSEQGFGAAHLSWNPYENTLNTSNVSSLGVLWQIPANGLGSAPTVTSGRVYVSTSAGLEAVSAATGALIWKVLPSTSFFASAAIAGANLYIGAYNNSLMYGLNAATGAVVWSQATGGRFLSSPVVAGGLVYAGCQDGKMYAFSATTGAIAWTYTTGFSINSSPAVVNSVVYFGSEDHKVYALNAKTGALIWSYTTGDSVLSSVAVSNGVVYVGSEDTKLYAFNAAGTNPGALLWSYTTGGVVASPAVAKGIVYFGSSDGTAYAANAQSGALVWQTATAGPLAASAVANGVVYFSSNNSFFAMDASYGEILATGVTGLSTLGNPTISDGVLYIGSYTGDTYAFSLLSGVNPAARRSTEPPLPSSLRPNLSLVAQH